MIGALLVGLGFGFSGGIAPGPLHTLIMTMALQRGFAAGARVAVAPLLTDAPIIALTVVVVGSMPEPAVRSLGIAGGIYLLFLGVQTLRDATGAIPSPESARPLHDYRRGVVANLLNPHPWLFWIGVGAPTLVGYWREGPGRAVVFLGGFYLRLIGSKVMVAFLIARGARLLRDRTQQRMVAVGGALLMGLGAYILWRYTLGGG